MGMGSSKSKSEDREEAVEIADIKWVPIENMPVEIWEKVFWNLVDFKDLISVNTASNYWSPILASEKSTWLFGAAFPSIMEYLSKSDILKCRQVCRLWLSGVDNFLENNGFQRPAYKSLISNCGKIYNLDQRVDKLQSMLADKHMDYNNFTKAQARKILRNAVQFPNYRLVGKSYQITDNPSQRYFAAHQKLQVLKIFGRKLQYLEIHIQDFLLVEILSHIYRYVKLTPNLHKLTIGIGKTFRSSYPYDHNDKESLINEDGTRLWLCDPNLTNVADKLRDVIPNLETFQIRVRAEYSVITLIMFDMLRGSNLTSLLLEPMPLSCNFTTGWENLVDLSLAIEKDGQLESLLHLTSPVRRFTLSLYDDVDVRLMFKAVCHFKETLEDFSLNLQRHGVGGFFYYYFEHGLPDEYPGLKTLLAPFANLKALGTFPNLKRACFTSYWPVSLNYLCGAKHTLEYLHINFQSDDMDKWKKFLGFVYPAYEWTESLDLLDFLDGMTSSNRFKLYGSNVWRLCPKLKILTVNLNRTYGEWEFRRDIYEKMKLGK